MVWTFCSDLTSYRQDAGGVGEIVVTDAMLVTNFRQGGVAGGNILPLYMYAVGPQFAETHIT